MIGVLPFPAFVALVIMAFAFFAFAIYEIAFAIDRRNERLGESVESFEGATSISEMVDAKEEANARHA